MLFAPTRRLALAVLPAVLPAILGSSACRTAAPAPAAVSRAPSTEAGETRGPPTEPGWQTLAQEDGITVSSRPSEHSPLPVFRGVGLVNAPLPTVLAVVADAARHQEWVFSCSDSGMVQRRGPASGIVYNRTATPWPVPDRDVVLDIEVDVGAGEREVRVRFSATEHPDRPPVDGVVRMTYLVGHYHLWAEGEGRTRVEYQVDSDPGGSLPTWLATRGTREMPLQTLLGLRAQLERTQGQYTEQVEAIREQIRAR